MVILKQISLFNFKNYATATLHFQAGVNAIAGINGLGKTNVLDAIHFLSLCKSYFNTPDTLVIKHGEDMMTINATFNVAQREEQIFCGLKKGTKKVFKRGQKEYEKLSDHIGLLPVVMIAPDDVHLIIGSSEERRKMMDAVLSQQNNEYLQRLITYNNALQQRNALLKLFFKSRYFDRDQLAVYDDVLIVNGTYIHQQRQLFMSKFNELLQKHFSFLVSQAELAVVNYQSHLTDATLDQLLKQNLERDKALQYTSVGIHRDDLNFFIDGYSVKKFASQGQQKTILIAIKLAQFQFIEQHCGIKPILLLDDIFDKLDANRTTQLMHLVSEHTFGQIIITDTNPERVSGIFSKLSLPLHHIKLEEKIFNPTTTHAEA